MKKVVILAVAFIAVFAVSLKVNSSTRGLPPNYYCQYDEEKGECREDAYGWACYGVNEDCSWMN